MTEDTINLLDTPLETPIVNSQPAPPLRIPDSLAARAATGAQNLVPDATASQADDTLASTPPTTSCGNM